MGPRLRPQRRRGCRARWPEAPALTAWCVCGGGEGCRARGGGGVAERTGPRLGPRRCGGGVPSPGPHLAAEAARGGRGRLGSGPLSHGAQRGVAFATGSWGVVERGIARRSGQAPTAPRARGGAAPPPGCEGGRVPPVRAVRALAQRGQPRHVGAVRPDGSRRRGRPVARRRAGAGGSGSSGADAATESRSGSRYLARTPAAPRPRLLVRRPAMHLTSPALWRKGRARGPVARGPAVRRRRPCAAAEEGVSRVGGRSSGGGGRARWRGAGEERKGGGGGQERGARRRGGG